MEFRKIIIEQLLVENRVDDAKSFVVKDYQEALIPQSYKNGTRMGEWFEDLVSTDPSGNQKYLMWQLNQMRRIQGRFHPFMVSQHLLDDVIVAVELFHRTQNIITPEKIENIVRNIPGGRVEFPDRSGRYSGDQFSVEYLKKILKSPRDINSYYDYRMVIGICKAISKLPTKGSIKKESNKILDNDYWLVIQPLSWNASCHYGADTRWCTTAKEGPEQFNRYQNDKNSLFYFIPKSEPEDGDYFYKAGHWSEWDLSKIALHIDVSIDFTFYDAGDDAIDYSEIEEMVTSVFGTASWEKFREGISRAVDIHREKLGV